LTANKPHPDALPAFTSWPVFDESAKIQGYFDISLPGQPHLAPAATTFTYR